MPKALKCIPLIEILNDKEAGQDFAVKSKENNI
jgi:hypothetical protein